MRRSASILILVLAACVAEPPERSPLPDVSEMTDQPLGCQLATGEPLGVLVTGTLEDSAADGSLMENDIITAVNGTPTTDRPALSAIMDGLSPGDEIEVQYLRDEVPASASIVLGTNPNDESRAFIGINIQTAFDRVSIDDINDIVEPGRAVRPIQIGGRLFVVDPLQKRWQPFTEAPDSGSWVSTPTGLYAITGSADRQIIDLITGGTIQHDGFQGWTLNSLIGSIGQDLIAFVFTERSEGDGFNFALAAFDPLGAETRWVVPLAANFGQPIVAYGSFDRTAVMVVGTDESESQFNMILLDSSGVPSEQPLPTALGIPLGWFDNQSMTYLTSNIVSVANLISGDTQTFTLPEALAGTSLAPVGDGQHVLAVAGRELYVHQLGDASNFHAIATNCQITRTGAPGWGT
jgi:hypothetical protein